MNAAAVLDRRESISSPSLTAKDEAVLVDSFFLPGGILDPDLDEGKEEESTKVSTSANNEWPTTTNAAPEEAKVEETEPEQRDSFWSTGGAESQANNSYLAAQPFPPEPSWSKAQPPGFPLDDYLHASNRDSQEGQEVQDLLLNPATSLFPQESSLSGSYTKLSMVPEAEIEAEPRLQPPPPPGIPPLGSNPPLASPDPLVAALGTAKPPPSLQEQEDVRQMVLALSSSLNNIGADPRQVPDHLLRPDSPPKIIRRRSSSISGSNRKTTSIPLGFSDGDLEDGDGDEDDLHSTTSSLSSGSAYNRSESPVQLSDHYVPPAASILPQQTLPIESYTFSAQATTTVPPPPGYQPLPVPTLQFEPEEGLSSPPPPASPTVLTIPSPPPPPGFGIIPPQSLSISDETPKAKNSELESAQPMAVISDEGSILSEPPMDVAHRPDPPKEEIDPQTTTIAITTDVSRAAKPATTTTTISEHPAAAATGPSTASKRRRQNRKQPKNNTTTTTESKYSTVQPPPQINNSRIQTRNSRKQTKKNTSTTASTVSKTRPKQPQPEIVLPLIALAQQVVRFGTTLLTIMIQEAVKEAVERKCIALDYIALYLAPVLAEAIMDQWVWLPHFFPGVTTALALGWVCHRMEKDPPMLSIGDLSKSTTMDEKPSKSTLSKKRKGATTEPHSKNHNTTCTTQAPLAEDQRWQEIRVMEAKFCERALKNLRWSLPLVVVTVSIVQTSDELEGLPCLRLVAAFLLTMLKTHNLFSPLAWISASIQILMLLGLRDSNTYMKRWCGLEIIVSSLGLSTLRFLRLGVVVKRKKV